MKKINGPQNYVGLIRTLEAQTLSKRSISIRMADILTSRFGTARFFIILLIVTFIWILINIGVVPGFPVFDPYPFILLTMIASVGAIFLTVIVLISQNRQSYINTLRNELLLQMILISERELTKALQILNNGLNKGKNRDKDLKEMLSQTNVSLIQQIIEKQINGHNI